MTDLDPHYYRAVIKGNESKEAQRVRVSQDPQDPQKIKYEPESPAPTEGRKEDQGKLRWDLLPESMKEVINVYTVGASVYTDRNWELGLKWGRVFGAMMRHAWAWWWGEQRHDKGMHHLASVAWCALALMEYERTHPELDDRPKKEEKK